MKFLEISIFGENKSSYNARKLNSWFQIWDVIKLKLKILLHWDYNTLINKRTVSYIYAGEMDKNSDMQV